MTAVVYIYNSKIWKELLENAIGLGKVLIEAIDNETGETICTWEYGVAYLKDNSILLDGGIYYPDIKTAEKDLSDFAKSFIFVKENDKVEISWY